MLAPIILFVYNRLYHTQKAVEALRANVFADQSDLFIYSDGPKNTSAESQVVAVRQYIKKISGFKTVTIIEREKNIGLARSIISGVTEVIERHGKAIILEDDLVSSPYFLRYMNEALDIYEKDDQVISIHGYIYPVKENLPETFFLKGADCWGWGTWKRGWELFDPDGKSHMNELRKRKLIYAFDFHNGYPYYKMLSDQIKGKNNSWAILWYASAFLKDKLTLYPGRPLINHIGNDGSGTHTKESDVHNVQLSVDPILVKKIEINSNQYAFDVFKKHLHAIRPKYREIIIGVLKNAIKSLKMKGK